MQNNRFFHNVQHDDILYINKDHCLAEMDAVMDLA